MDCQGCPEGLSAQRLACTTKQDPAAKRCSLTESRCPRRQGVKLQTEFLALNKSLLSHG